MMICGEGCRFASDSHSCPSESRYLDLVRCPAFQTLQRVAVHIWIYSNICNQRTMTQEPMRTGFVNTGFLHSTGLKWLFLIPLSLTHPSATAPSSPRLPHSYFPLSLSLSGTQYSRSHSPAGSLGCLLLGWTTTAGPQSPVSRCSC